ncbi:adenylate/guanylate cyclase domain-containing protein [Acuticoccus sp. M5D2P5]|uniref:adenylate/guanylate cyclase domain-containing protein n=1 Tax=Acuticoccus kalidii TaxID=2910977 RepID=UPI001F203957|nr:adenylate/guanylate cyclase domain-containing protein [Acuticoccus kalidii]MCF3936183.1 adenylate/guanylate cyclase domain-containing protein [Acuticoccus kalidii]
MTLLPKSLFRHLGLSDAMTARMPARVWNLVVAEEERSERLIGWVQLVIAGTFATLYLIAPRPTDASTMFEPVPIALSVYLAFTAIRIIAAYRGFLPGWLLVCSMLADVTLLYGLIWSFHIAYGQPAAFYLKVPTFAYVFLFIAVRALRFDPRFVISQGLIAAVGWLLMVLYAVWSSGGAAITRSFVAYLTDNLVLIGAEFDKIFTILMLTGVLALALHRARATLLTAAREGAATRDMRRYFGAGVAESITSRETEASAGEAEGRDAAILMLDLRNFSHFAAVRAPREVVTTLTAYHALVIPLIEREGGIIDKFLGDGVMATFGAVSPSESAAADALKALQAIMEQAPAWSDDIAAKGLPPVPIQGAAVAGRVVAATLGNQERLEFTVIGSAANIAAKLEKHNKIAKTAALTTEETLRRAETQGYHGTPTSLGACEVAGCDEPLHLWKLA